MQRVNNRMVDTINRMYSFEDSIYKYNKINPRQLNYELNNPFQRFFRVSLRGNHVEIPMFAKSIIHPRLFNILLTSNDAPREDIIIPFPCTGTVGIHRTVDAIVRSLIVNMNTRQDMCLYAETNKGEGYYGCGGTLFNKDMIPIFLNVLVGDIENHTLTYKKVRTYIHPSVFYSEGVVEKCIINKIIPYVMQNRVRVYSGHEYASILYSIGPSNITLYQRAIPEIVVADIGDRFFCKPVLPSVLYTNDNINDTLNENIDDVFKIMEI